MTGSWLPGSVLEIGAGAGDATGRFVDRGFRVTANDLGEESRAILRARFGTRIAVVDDPADIAPQSVDYLFAFEVLEHIVDDLAALQSWLDHLRPGGRVLFSVPAHQRKYGQADLAVGHVRRYERAQLMSLLEDAGLIDVEIYNYGFPLGNALRWVQTVLGVVTSAEVTEPAGECERVARTLSSGVDTTSAVKQLRWLSRPRVLRPFVALQRVAYRRDWSDGYVATAIRPPA